MTSATPTTSVSYYGRPPFSKLDALARRMCSAETGVQPRMQKYFRTSLPASFTGAELVQWLLAAGLDIDDSAEALHLAQVLAQHGYLFAVIDRAAPVRDDGTLYRFQIPYFWPSHSGSPDTLEYAVYLCKRLLRNEEKHGLEPYEVEAYNRLLELLGHTWDFVATQAEMQLKLHKDKKKQDKVVFDSQERSYWRLHRPPPGPGPSTSSVLESCPIQRRTRKKTARMYALEIERLKSTLKTKPYFKAGISTDQLITWSDQFGDYDPFIGGCSPSNPWVSDDTTYWSMNADAVDVPTERSEYLAPGAQCQVNIDNRTLNAAIAAMNDPSIPKRHAFSIAEEQIFTLFSRDSYPRFVKSDIYREALQNSRSQQSRPWRKLFAPGTAGGAGKKASAPGRAANKVARSDEVTTGNISIARDQPSSAGV